MKRRAKGGSMLVNIVTFSHRTRCYPLKVCAKTPLNVPPPFTFVSFYVLVAMHVFVFSMSRRSDLHIYKN